MASFFRTFLLQSFPGCFINSRRCPIQSPPLCPLDVRARPSAFHLNFSSLALATASKIIFSNPIQAPLLFPLINIFPRDLDLGPSQHIAAMGKGKGKSSKRAEKSAIKASKKEAKRVARGSFPSLPFLLSKFPNSLLLQSTKLYTKQNISTESAALNGPPKRTSLKSARKLAQKAKNQSRPVPASSIPADQPKPLLKPPQHAKWPALFKRHLGLIESHIRGLDRVMQSMKSEMEGMSEEMRQESELGVRGNWRRICGMLDRSREVLAQARECGEGILPSQFLRDKKGLGVAGKSYEPLLPKLVERAEKLGYNNWSAEGVNGGGKVDGEGDSEMEDVSSLSSDLDTDSESELSSSSASESSDDSDSGSEDKSKKATVEDEDEKAQENKPEPAVESNPYFVIDTQPMPVRGLKKPPLASIKHNNTNPEQPLNGEPKKSKKSKKAEKAEKEQVVEEPSEAKPEPPKQEPTPTTSSKKSKKRTHDDAPEEKNSKKAKKEKPVNTEPAAPQTYPEPEPAPPKKSKKRSNSSITDSADGKKSKKHKSTEPEAKPEQEVEAEPPAVDFNEVQRKLQAEVEAGEAAAQAARAKKEKKKKRRRSSGDGDALPVEGVKSTLR